MAQKILIVDDDIDSLKLIGLMLQRHGYEVVAANAGNQALTKASAEMPDLIILDVMMPDMNGYEVCRRLRANTDTQNIPIIMFTAKTLVDDKVTGFEAGADDYLTKPTHPAELASRVKSILARNATGQARPTSRSERNRTIGIIGAKGGVGTTTVALNIGASLASTDRDPVVADFRLGMGSLGAFIGLKHSRSMANILSKPGKEIKADMVANGIATHQAGFRVLLSSTHPREAQIAFAPDAAVAVVEHLRAIADPSIFDLGYGLTQAAARLLTEMDQIVVVSEPTMTTLTMARELINEIENMGIILAGRLHVVIVSRIQTGQHVSWQDAEQILGQEIRAIISAAPELALQATDAGLPIVIYQPKAIVSTQFRKLSEDISAPVQGVIRPLQ